MLKEPRTAWPERVRNRGTPRLARRHFGDTPRVTFVIHACFLIQWAGLNILIDPIYSNRCSPIPLCGPKRVRKPAVPFQRLPPIDLVLISHNHYDHLDLATVTRLARHHSPHFICGLGDKRLLQWCGAKNVTELDWWQSPELNLPLKLTYTQAQHWSGRGWHDQMKSLWGGFFIENRNFRLYFAGDTGYGPHFSSIRERLGAPDLSLLPVGAYEPRWFMRDHHMNPEDSVSAHCDLQSALSIGMHFGSFQLSNEAIDAHVADLERACAKLKVTNFRLLEFGETYIAEEAAESLDAAPPLMTADQKLRTYRHV